MSIALAEETFPGVRMAPPEVRFPIIRKEEHILQFLVGLTRGPLAGFSDVDFLTGMPPMVMQHGWRYLLDREVDARDTEVLVEAFYTNGWGTLQKTRRGIRTLFTVPAQDAEGNAVFLRFRVSVVLVRVPRSPNNTSMGVQISLRAIADKPPTWQELDLPEVLIRNCFFRDGIVLVTGPTGSGKSSTLAAMIRFALEEAPELIDHKFVTLEAPIEFVYDHPRVSQSQVPEHIESFAQGVVEAMVRRPNVILVGEAKDQETIRAAIEAAMTGHQVFTTVHTTGVANAVGRMIQRFDGAEARSMAADLLESLRLVLSQRLVNTPNGHLQAVREWLFLDSAMRIRLLRTPLEQLTAAITDELHAHGHSFAQDADALLAGQRITLEAHAWVMSGYA